MQQLTPTGSRSFTPLSTLALGTSHVLHPQACNPAMDLVVLLASATPVSAPTQSVKGKARATAPDMSAWRGTKVVLWRMLGSKVWEVELKGWVAGLVWSADGLYLSLLVITMSARRAVLEHRSVHTGEELKVIPVDLPESVWENGLAGSGVDMSWIDNDMKWEDPTDGSARMIIASLPTVTPIEPPKPVINNPFAKASAASTSKLPHAKLSTFPSLLPSTTTWPPHVLRIVLPHARLQLLTGSFPCPTSLSASHLRLGQSADMLALYLNTILRGIESVEAAWRDSSKQTMLWREELEECGKLQGMPVRDVHADLFRLLMTGRCREAVSEWLGNKLTGRMLTKWEQSLTATFKIIQDVIIESILPAVERIIILLQELRGWSRSLQHSSGLHLDSDTVETCINLTAGLIKLTERIRQDAEHEALAAAAWVAWLKYETAQAGSGGGDEPPTPTHDLKLAWSFLVNGFVRSIFSTYFPDNTPSRPPTDELPDSFISGLSIKSQPLALDAILTDTMACLCGKSSRTVLQSPLVDTDEGMSLDQSSMDLSSTGENTRAIDESGLDLDDEGDKTDSSGVDDEVIDSDDESTGTAGNHRKDDEDEKEAVRVLELEPWVWTNSLIKATQGLIRDAVSEEGLARDEDGGGVIEAMTSVWRSGGEVWGAAIREDGRSISLIKDQPTKRAGILTLGPTGTILAVEFFDDLELAFIVQSPDGLYLGTMDYKANFKRVTAFTAGVAKVEDLDDGRIIIPIDFERTRYLGPVPSTAIAAGQEMEESMIGLALNGRKGRRVGCVVGVKEGGEVDVWDMEDDEGVEEEEEEEEVEGEDEITEEGKEDESM